MKHFILLFIIPLLLFNSTSPKEDIIGKWTSQNAHEIEYFIFDAEGYATFASKDITIGGKEFIMNGEKGKMTYNLKTESTIIEVDFTITKVESGESKTIAGIIEFLDKDHLQIDMSFDTERPTKFGNDTILLVRVK